jgi:hypothetical protein
MKLEVVQLVVGTETPAGDGVSGALRCVIRLPGGSMRAAVLKRCPLDEVIAEAFCALLLRAWQLPVPDPFLVEESTGLSFASADMGYPNLKQQLGIGGLPQGLARDAALAVARVLACSFPTSPLAAACDEAIDNRDRNLGNVLWDGQSEAWIDHALAVGRGGHLPDRSVLCAMVVGMSDQDRFSQAAVAQCLILDRASPAAVDDVLSSSAVGATSLAPFIASRLAVLGGRLLARFPTPGDLLSMP